MRTPTMPSRSRRARRTRAAATLRPVPSPRERGDRGLAAVARAPRRRRTRAKLLYAAPTPLRATPILRLVVSNPHVRALGTAIATRRGHLTLVAARATPLGPMGRIDEPWADDEPRAFLMIVLGLAAAGLVAVATSIGRLISAAL